MRRLHDALKGRALGYTAHGPIALNFMDRPEIAARHLAVAKAAIEVAAEIGVVHLILHSGRAEPQTESELEALYARQCEAFASLGELAAQHAMIIAVENIPPSGAKERIALPSRLAREIEAIGHPNVRGCLDFSHAAIDCAAAGVDFLTEAKALARVAIHLHIHDSFGDPAQMWTCSRSERVAYGLGDLHLPLGWGDLPWLAIMADFAFLPDVIFNLELPVPYWFELENSVGAMREMIEIYRARRASA
jgi:sugar phosphate isomerase/epimerase